MQVIKRSSDILDISIQLSRDYYNNTEGLLGRWDGIANDLANSSGTVFPVATTSPQRIHEIGNTCKLHLLSTIVLSILHYLPI